MRDSSRSALIAALAAIAVAFAAATLTSTVDPDGGSSSGSDGDGIGDGEGSGVAPPSQSEPTPGESLEIPFVSELLGIIVALVALAAIAYVLVYRRDALEHALAIVIAAVAFAVLLQLLSDVESISQMAGSGDGGVFGDGSGDGLVGGGDATRPSAPILTALLVLGLVVVGAVAVVLGTETEDDDPPAESDAERTDSGAIGRAAGRAADRLEADAATDVDNEVYRAWREMTGLLDVDDPETSTPREFATAAVDADLGRDDVDEMTRLFEDVRYGRARPTADRERRAIAVLRRIEARYGEDEP